MLHSGLILKWPRLLGCYPKHNAMTVSSVLPTAHYIKKPDGAYPTLLIIIAIALAYFIAGKLGYTLPIFLGHYASLIWPPAGIALAGILVYGNRVWPGILLGAFLINGLNPIDASFASGKLTNLLITLAISSGATLQALAGAYWLKRYTGYPNGLKDPKAILLFLLYGGVLSALINSTLSVSLLVATGKTPLENALNNWLTWWSGDLFGIIIFTPLALAWLLKDTDAWRHRRLAITLPILGMFVLTAATVIYERQANNERISLEFNEQIEALNHDLKTGFANYGAILYTLQSFYKASKDVDKEAFSRYTQLLLLNTKGIQALQWAPIIKADEREAFEKRHQYQGQATFQITERDALKNMVRAKNNPTYVVVTFIEPYLGNESALGYDTFPNQDRQDALNRAASTDEFTLSSPIELVQEKAKQLGVLGYLPLYRKGLPVQTPAEKRLAVSAYVVGVFKISGIVNAALEDKNTRGISYRLLDLSAPAAQQLLYTSDQSFPEPLVLQEKSWISPKITLIGRLALPFGGRIWQFEIVPNQDYFASHRSGQVWQMMLIGLLTTSLVSVFSLLMSGRTQMLQQLVNERTEELQQQHLHALLLMHEKEKNQTLLSEANEGIARAEALAKTKAQFLAHMSHELRTPLSHIIGYSDLALLEAMSTTSNDYIKIVNRSSKDLLTIINNILDSSKLEAGLMTLNLEPFTLTDIKTTLHELLIHAAQLKGLSLTINIEDSVPNRLIGDSLRLRQVLINLLGNSIKFTQQGSVTLNISLKHLDANEARLLFAVTDTGKGMSAEQQAKLFIAFSQVNDSYTQNAEGTGLGLSISQDIVKLMGGLIKVDSHVDLGSCFSFELVLALALTTIEPPLTLTPTITPNSEPLSGVRILVAEDEDFGQKLIKGHLKRFGANVVLTNNGLEALAILEQQDFDLVLMDLHMPIMDGFTATAEIRKQTRYAQLPVIAFSASLSDEDKQHCLAVGMNDYVDKPFNKIALLATLERWLKR